MRDETQASGPSPHLQVGSGQRGAPQVAVLQFGVLQRGHAQVDPRHLAALQVHALQVGA